MLPPKVQIAISTIYKLWMDRCQSFVASREYTDVSTTMVSQTTRAFDFTIEAKALFKNLLNKNKGFVNWASEVEEAIEKALAEVEAMKKS